jgi:voltage-gated potassium channel
LIFWQLDYWIFLAYNPLRNKAGAGVMKRDKKQHSPAGWRGTIYRVIFEHDTPGGKLFDVTLIASIIVSVIVVMLDSVIAVRGVYGNAFYIIEWFFTILFTVEYILHI